MPDSPTENDVRDKAGTPSPARKPSAAERRPGDYYYDDAFGYEKYVDDGDDDQAELAREIGESAEGREKTIANGDAKA